MNDKRVSQGLFIISVLVVAALSITFATADGPGTGSTIYVYADGSGDYTTIQSAIDNASDGDTIFVFNGIYYENVIVNKPINLIGENRDATVIDSNGTGDVVNVTADQVNISKFTIRNGSNGIVVSSGNNTISNCNISNNSNSGIMLNHSNNNTIVDNDISSNGVGIRVSTSSSNNIGNCSIFDNMDDGISLTNSANNTLINNLVWRNADGIMIFSSSDNNDIINNNISNNGFGLYLYYADENEIFRNNISSNADDGISITYSSFNIISENNISSNNASYNNNKGVDISSSSNNNIFFHNNLIENNINAMDEGVNTWDNGYPSGGNYWDDFDEPSEGAYDNNSDGIIDTPYSIPGGSNSDRYPFITPVDRIPPFTTCTANGTAGNNGWYVSNVTVNLTAIDNGSRINYTLYCIGGGSWIQYNNSFVISADGSHTVDYYSVDTVGNKESMKSAVVNIDKTSPYIDCYLQPETPDGNNGWYTGNVEVTLSADDNASGVESICYKINQDIWRDYSGYFLIPTEGNHTFTFSARDYAGHETTKSTNIKIDKTAPSVIILAPTEEYVKGIVDIKWNASDNVDPDLNGSISIYFVRENESVEIASGLNNTGEYEWNTFSFEDGHYTLKISAVDEAGNIGNGTSQSFILDNMPPTIVIDQPRGGEVLGGGKNLDIFWNASDDIDKNLDGTIWISYSHDGGYTWNNIVERYANNGYTPYGIGDWEEGTYVLRINATDDAGNTGWAMSGNFTIDTTPPSVTINRPKSGYLYLNIAGREILPSVPISLIPLPYNTVIIGKITIGISASDGLSEIDRVEIDAGDTTKVLYDTPYRFEWNTPMGKCDLTVTAYDMAGNSGEDELMNIFCINL
ncbi:MAG: NosD domain-containing protein [Candidatus Thermoplasmatota archaeon]|nr:NosD domain-containing protein [Candidatus Thermoplasmatota archaeon]